MAEEDTKSEVDVTVDEGAELAQSGGAPPASEDVEANNDLDARHEEDDTDLGEDFSEMDEEFGSKFSSPEAKEETPLEETAVEEEEESVEKATASKEEPTEETPSEDSKAEASSEVPKDFEEALARIQELEARLKPAPREKSAEEGKDAEPGSEEQPKSGEGVDPAVLREKALEHLANTRYALSPEDADKVITAPEEVLPKLASTLYLDVYTDVMKGIQRALPLMLERHKDQQAFSEAQDTAIFSRFPQLQRSNAEHINTLERVRQTYDTLNPGVPQARRLAEIGAQTMFALGISPEPATRAPVKPKATPHRPARAGRSGGGTGTSAPENEFEEMSLEGDDGF